MMRAAIQHYLSQTPAARRQLILSYLLQLDPAMVDMVSQTLPPDARASLAALIDALKAWKE